MNISFCRSATSLTIASIFTKSRIDLKVLIYVFLKSNAATNSASTPAIQSTILHELNAIKANAPYISFTKDGVIVDANKLFLDAVGYRLDEVVGQHHRIFCEPEYVQSLEYGQFWNRLANGESFTGTFRRLTKDRSVLHLEASYFPVLDELGHVSKVIKIAKDITLMQNQLMNKDAVLTALDRSLAVIEFLPDGTILTANQNFLNTVHYQLRDIAGKHHRIFCDDAFYRENPHFWQNLAAGQHRFGKFKRFNANKEVLWLEATYNPILDEQGKVF